MDEEDYAGGMDSPAPRWLIIIAIIAAVYLGFLWSENIAEQNTQPTPKPSPTVILEPAQWIKEP